MKIRKVATEHPYFIKTYEKKPGLRFYVFKEQNDFFWIEEDRYDWGVSSCGSCNVALSWLHFPQWFKELYANFILDEINDKKTKILLGSINGRKVKYLLRLYINANQILSDKSKEELVLLFNENFETKIE